MPSPSTKPQASRSSSHWTPLLWTAVLATGAVAIACTHAGDEESSWLTGQTAGVRGGQETGEYDYVVSLAEGNTGTCTGFMVTPFCGITAAHCDEDRAARGKLGFRGDGPRADIVSVVRMEGEDIAVFKLDAEDTGARGWPHVALSYDEMPEGNFQDVTMVGYGENANGAGAGTKRVGTGAYAGEDNGLYVVMPGGPGVGQIVCEGDSGGPLLFQGKAWGVMSQLATNGGCEAVQHGHYARTASQPAQLKSIIAHLECDGPPEDGGVDGGEDAGEPDAGEDAGAPDAGEDAGEPDAGADAGEPDAGEDAGPEDGGGSAEDAGDGSGEDAGDTGEDAG
jgi:hypothetical protein